MNHWVKWSTVFSCFVVEEMTSSAKSQVYKGEQACRGDIKQRGGLLI